VVAYVSDFHMSILEKNMDDKGAMNRKGCVRTLLRLMYFDIATSEISKLVC